MKKPPLTPAARAINREAKREKTTAQRIARHNRSEYRRLYRIGNPHSFTSDDYWLFVVSCFGVILVMAAMASLNTVLPDIATDTGATQAQLTWIVDAYTLVLAGLLLPAGAIGDRFGRKGVFIAGLVIFTAATLIPVWTTTPEALITSRAIAGFGASFVMPSTLSILASRVPTRRRPLAIAIWGGAAGIGAVIGLVGSGSILLKFSWHGIFVALSSFAAIIAILSFTIEESKDANPPRFDLVGAVLSSAFIILLVLCLIQAPDAGWTNAWIISGFVFSALFLIAFIVWELKSDHPLLDVRFFGYRGFGSGSLSLLIQFVATFGLFYALVQYMQLVMGYSPITSAFSMAPMVPPCLIFALLSIWVTRKIGQKWLLVLGHLVLAASLLMFIPVDTHTEYWYLVLIMLLFASGLGLTAAPATTAIMLQTPEKKYGVASAVNDSAREIGAALGIAIAGSIVTSVYSDRIAGISQRVQQVLGMAEQFGQAPAGTAASVGSAIDGSLAGAAGVAHELSHNPLIMANPLTRNLPAELLSIGQDAFTHSQFVVAMVLAGVQIATALILAVWAPGYRVLKSRKELEAVQDARDALPMSIKVALDKVAAVRYLFVASDFDGTLAPLVKDPATSTPLPGSIEALNQLSEVPHTQVALISGRSIAELRKVSQVPSGSDIHLIGCHGAEISGYDDKLTSQQKSLLRTLTKEVEAASEAIPGSTVEEKKCSVALHIRRAKKKSQAEAAAQELEEKLSALPGVVLNRGKMVSEFSVTTVTKGTALKRWAYDGLHMAHAVVYVGDDVTDENAFQFLAENPTPGRPRDVTIKVGEGETLARFRVENELLASAALDYLATVRDEYADAHFTRADRKTDRKEEKKLRKTVRKERRADRLRAGKELGKDLVGKVTDRD